MSEVTEQNSASGERPSFLTVLCVLTFIGSGLGVLGGLLGLFGSTFLAMFAPAGSMIGVILGLIASGLCLFGAVKMWGLYKQGFMLYVAGCAVSIIGGLIGIFTFKMPNVDALNEATGGEMADEFAELSNAGTAMAESIAKSAMWSGWAIGLVVCIVFILMYNANKKHLVK